MTVRSKVTAGLTLLLAVVAGTAHGDWPMARQDGGRRAASPGQADLATPAVTFRYYLGGRVEKEHIFVHDGNGDGEEEIVFLAGGRLAASRPDGIALWSGEPVGLYRIDAVVDLDGDGVQDIVATGRPGRVTIWSAVDGRLQWRTDPADFGQEIGAVRVADLDGDGSLDLYVADCACGIPGSPGDVAYAYTFARGFGSGFDDGTQRLWQLERGREYDCGFNDVVVDLTGDGRADVLALASRYAYLFDGETGEKVSSGIAEAHGGYALGFAIPHGRARTDVVDVDSDGVLDVVCYSNNAADTEPASRAVFVLSHDAERPQEERLYVRWARHADAVDRDVHVYIHDGAADLDGDGRVEVSTTFRTGETSTTLVLDGVGGEVLATIEDSIARAIYDVGVAELPILIVERDAALLGFRFADFEATPAPAFALPLGAVTSFWDRDRWSRSSCAMGRVTVPLPSGRDGIVLRVGGAVQLWDVTAGAVPALLASHEVPVGVAISSVVPQRDAARPGPGLLLARSDGYVTVLDAGLSPINFGDGPQPLPGLRSGGYYSGTHDLGHTPAAARFDSSIDEIVVRDSLGNLLRLNASVASLAVAPEVVWSWPGAFFPLLIDIDTDGVRDVVARTGSSVMARQADGETEIFAAAAAGGGSGLVGDVVPLMGGASSPLLAVAVHDVREESTRFVALHADGSPAWESEPVAEAAPLPGHLTVADLDGDGADDLLTAPGAALHLLDGLSGVTIAVGHDGSPAMPLVVDGAGPVTHISAAADAEVAGLRLPRPIAASGPFEVIWSLGDDFAASRRLGTIVDCPTGPAFVTARSESAQAAVVSVDTGVVVATPFLAGGTLYTDEAAMRADGAVGGMLGNATAISELAPGRPAALLGSTDGYLYALDACIEPAELIWSLDLGAPVGEAVFSDTDGDGFEEILVTAGDGFLYGIDTEAFPAPPWVYDTDPDAGVLDEDVDITHGETLGATWGEVPGAAVYEWALFAIDGTRATPYWAGTEGRTALVPEAPAAAGRYFFAVRAVSPAGAVSPETLSNGTRYAHDPEVDEPGTGPADGCGCRQSDATPPGRWARMLAALLP